MIFCFDVQFQAKLLARFVIEKIDYSLNNTKLCAKFKKIKRLKGQEKVRTLRLLAGSFPPSGFDLLLRVIF